MNSAPSADDRLTPSGSLSGCHAGGRRAATAAAVEADVLMGLSGELRRSWMFIPLRGREGSTDPVERDGLADEANDRGAGGARDALGGRVSVSDGRGTRLPLSGGGTKSDGCG